MADKVTPADPRDGLRAKCPRCDDNDPLATQVSIDSSRGFKFAVMTCRCGHGEVAAYYDDDRSLQDLSDKFYRIAHARPEAVDGDVQSVVDDVMFGFRMASDRVFQQDAKRIADTYARKKCTTLTPDQSP